MLLGNMRIGPVLEVTTSFRHFKYGIEIRIWSVNQHNSQSWVARRMGSPKAGPEQAAADSQGSRTCVCAITLETGGTRRGRRMN